MGDDFAAKIREAEMAARRKDAIEREKGRAGTNAAPLLPRDKTDAPLRPSAGGERVTYGMGEKGDCWFLEGRELRNGDVIEVYTNAANGWLRGRFFWNGHPDDPHLVINVWDANGIRDEDGTPPFVGEMDASLPRGAVCRFPQQQPR